MKLSTSAVTSALAAKFAVDHVITKEVKKLERKNAKVAEHLFVEIRSALAAIDPDCDYNTWLKILMALHSLGLDSEAREWSAKGNKFDAKVFDDKWKSFTSDGVTINSLFHVAKNEYDWPGMPTVKNYIPAGEKGKPFPLQLPEIVEQVNQLGFDFCLHAGRLVIAQDGEAVYIDSPGILVAILSERAKVNWLNGVGHSKGELLEALKRRARVVDNVTPAPRFPPSARELYLYPAPEPVAGMVWLNKLRELVNPASEIDWLLILAAIATQVWGGPSGSRPVFLIIVDGDDKVGAGKTALATLIAKFGNRGGGPYIVRRFDPDTADKIDKHLVTPSPYSVRAVLLDNPKGEIGNEDLESRATATHIDGHQMYGGHRRIENHITYIIATNSDELTKDLTTRVVLIRIKPAKYDPDYQRKLAALDWDALYAELAWFFEQAPIKMAEHSRYPVWCAEVLGRLRFDNGEPAGDKLVQHIRQSARELENSSDIAHEMRERLVTLIESNGHDPARDVVLLPSRELANVLGNIVDNRSTLSTSAVTRLLKQNISNPQLHELSVNPNTSQRGFIWRGVASDSNTPKVPLVNLGAVASSDLF